MTGEFSRLSSPPAGRIPALTGPERTSSKDRRLFRLLPALLLLAGALRFTHLAFHLASPLGKVEEVFLYSDLHAFAQWGKEIAAGDILCRDTYHPYMDWMKEIAPLKTFEEWWGGKEIYHQAPLYAYLAGLSYALAGNPVPLFVFQILLSVLGVWLLFLLGKRLEGTGAGLWAAALGALFAPSIVLDAVLLRASLISSATLLSVYLLLRLEEAPSPGRAFGAGLLLGLGILLKPTWILFSLLAVPVLLAAWNPGRRKGRLLPLAGGILLALLPLPARNLAVGAPILSLSTRGPETALQNNNRFSDPALFSPPPAKQYRKWMEEGHSSLPAALAAAYRTWPEEGRSGWFLWHLRRKAEAAFRDMEYPNNVDFYAYRKATPFLAFLPTFGWISGASLAGIVLILLRGKEKRAWLVPLAAFLSLLAGILLAFAAGRYRLPLAFLLFLPAGVFLSRTAGLLARGRLLPAGILLGGALLLSLPSFLHAPTRVFFLGRKAIFLSGGDALLFEEIEALRPQEFTTSAKVLSAQGRKDEARRLLESYLEDLERFRRTWEGRTGREGALVLDRGLARAFKETARILRRLGRAPYAAELESRAALLEARSDRILRELLGGG